MKAHHRAASVTWDRDDRGTPQEVVDQVFGFLGLGEPDIDVCASYWNRKASIWWGHGGLENGWVEQSLVIGHLPRFWMNPPYSNIPPWVEKACVEAKRGCIVVGCLPDMPSSRWYQKWVWNQAPMVLMPRRRISFLRQDTGAKESGNPLPTCFPVWTPWSGVAGLVTQKLYLPD